MQAELADTGVLVADRHPEPLAQLPDDTVPIGRHERDLTQTDHGSTVASSPGMVGPGTQVANGRSNDAAATAPWSAAWAS